MSHDKYVLYGNPLSYFTRKLDAAMGWYAEPYDVEPKTPAVRDEIETRSGTHQVPVLRTPEGWLIADTTPLIDLLDGRAPARRLFPTGPLGVLVHVIEEWFDEWVPRTAVHYRWHYDECADFAAPAMAEAMAPDDESVRGGIEAMLRSWGPRSCRATGTDPEPQRRAAEDEYERILEALDAQLGETRFSLGDRPCAVDAVLLGGLWAHFDADPVPRRLVRKFERVTRWCAEAKSWDGDGKLAPFPSSTPFARFVLEEARGPYRSFIVGNAAALREKQKAFVVRVYDEDVSYLARLYPERSRRMIEHRIARRLDADEQRAVGDWLRGVGLHDVFMPAADSG